MMIKIQIAHTAQEKERVYRFRYLMHATGKAKWKPKLNHKLQTASDPADNEALIFFATTGTQVVGSLRLNTSQHKALPKHISQRLNINDLQKKLSNNLISTTTEIVIDPHWRGQTLASLLMVAHFEYLVKNNISLNFIGIHEDLRPLYERLGYRCIGDPDKQKIQSMLLCIFDYNHLINVVSPFALSLRLEHQDQHKNVKALVFKECKISPQLNFDLPLDLSSFWSEFSDRHARVFWNRPGFLDGLNKKQKNWVMKQAHLKTFTKGQRVTFDKQAWSVGLVLSGKIGDGLKKQSTFHWYDLFQAGDTFGQPILNESEQRQSALYVIENAQALFFSKNFIETIKNSDPILATKLSINFIAFTQEKLTKDNNHPSLMTDILPHFIEI